MPVSEMIRLSHDNLKSRDSRRGVRSTERFLKVERDGVNLRNLLKVCFQLSTQLFERRVQILFERKSRFEGVSYLF